MKIIRNLFHYLQKCKISMNLKMNECEKIKVEVIGRHI